MYKTVLLKRALGASVGIAIIALTAGVGVTHIGDRAYAGEGFFQKIGDGWRNGDWLPRYTGPKATPAASAPSSTANRVSVSYRVDCRDRDTGGDRADNTLTVAAPTREAAVAAIEQALRTRDICQDSGDLSRISVPGTGRYLN
jgi:hypothetical protein